MRKKTMKRTPKEDNRDLLLADSHFGGKLEGMTTELALLALTQNPRCRTEQFNKPVK